MKTHRSPEAATPEPARTPGASAASSTAATALDPLSGLYARSALGNQTVQRLLSPLGGTAVQEPSEGVPRGRAPGVMVQRFPAAGADSPPAAAVSSGGEGPVAAEPEATPATLLVEDGTTDLAPGQMRKGEFLAQLHAVVCPTAEAALRGTAWSSIGCPWIDHWFTHFGHRSASQVEASIRRFGSVGTVSSAADYIPLIAGRVRSAIDQWAAGDEVTAVPPTIADEVAPGGGGDEEAPVCEPPRSAGVLSGLVTRVGQVFMKRSPTIAAVSDANPAAVVGELGSGRSLDAGVKQRMEGAFGSSFSQVRLHADAPGQRVAGELGARAFAVGDHVAFASGEYRPGTPVGDALLAHELAHVVQQGGGSGRPSAKASGAQETSALEREADRSAVGAVMALWGGVRGKAGEISRGATPRLRSSLQLQGCFLTGCKTEEDKKPDEKKEVPWWEEEVETGPASGVFVRSPYNIGQLQHRLRQVEVVVEVGQSSVKKTPPGEKAWQFFDRAEVKTTQWTPEEVKKKVAAIFPPGGEVYVWKKTGGGILAQVEKIVADFRKQHPKTFSILQGRDMAREGTKSNCIESCNRAFSELYGPQAMPSDAEHFGTTVQGTIQKLKERKLAAASKVFGAEYVGKGDRFQILKPEDLTKVKFGGAGQWVEEQAKSLSEDGVVAFAVNLSNGFHSATIVVHKQGSKVVMAWKDQFGVAITDAGGIDAKVKHFVRIRYRYWLRKGYNDLFDPDVEGVDEITDDAKREAAEKRVKSSVLADIAKNEFVRVKPL